jgi:site-specific recombinase XerD
MNLEHVSVENTEYHPEHLVCEPDKPTACPPEETQSSSKHSVSSPAIARVLRELSDKELCGQDHVRHYLHDLYCRNCRPNTILSNGSAIILFLCFLKATGREHLETVTRDDVGAFVEHEQDRGMRPRTVSTRLQVLYGFFRFLMERDVIHPDVLKRRMHIKIPDALPRAIDPEDIRKLLAVIKKPRDRAMILTLLRTGMRIGELLNTEIKDLNLQEKCIEIFEAQKNRVGRVVYVSDDACGALKKWLKLKKEQTQFLFCGRGGQPLSYPAAWAVFKKYLDKAGLSHKGYTLHCLRHTCASELLNAGMHLECLQPLLGHHSIEMTRRYARLTDNTRREQYYKAMAVIERGDMNGYYRFDPQLP